VARKRRKDLNDKVRKLIAELSTIPEKLARFIQDPKAVMEAAKIPKKHRVGVRDAVALEFSERLALLMSYHQHY